MLYAVGLVVFLIDRTGSPSWVSAALIGRMAALTLLGPFGAVLADRTDRRRLMVGLDLARAAAMLAAAFVVASDGPPIAVVGLVVLTAALTTPYRPSTVVATPLLVGEDDLAAANAAVASLNQLAWFAGPALGAAIVAIASPTAAFAVNAGTYVVAGLLVLGVGNIDGRRRDASAPANPGASIDQPGVLRQLVEGGRALRFVPGMIALTLILVAIVFAYGIEMVVQVLVVQDRLGRNPGDVGILTAAVGVGGLLAVPFASRIASRPDAGRLLAVSGVLMGAPLALLAITSNIVVACGLMVVEGVGNILLDVFFVTLLQRACPEHVLGRVSALQDSSGSLFQLVGTALAPVMVSVTSLEVTLWVGGGSLVLASLLLAPSLQAISNRTEAARLRLAPLAAEIHRFGPFISTALATQERLARGLTVVEVAAGHVVFSEGDQPDALYLIRSGSVRVSTASDGPVRRLAAGDWFGEIGLLRQVPRTASIEALEPTVLLAIPGQLFLDAVAGGERASEALTSTMSSRLAQTHPHLM